MWIYKGKPFTEEMIQDYYGFIYCIENITNGKKYIGRKFFTKASTKKVKGKKKKVRSPSDWQTYYGSGEQIIEAVDSLGREHFKFEILHLCKTLGECKYVETRTLFLEDVLRTKLPNGDYMFYNGNIMMRYTRHNIGKP